MERSEWVLASTSTDLYGGLARHALGREEVRYVAMQAAEVARVSVTCFQLARDFGWSEAEAQRVQADATFARLVSGAGGLLGVTPVGSQPRRA